MKNLVAITLFACILFFGFNQSFSQSSAETSNEELLIIVDGQNQEKGFDLRSIDPKTISSLDIIKETLKLKPYGEEGKNGVILVSTQGNPNQNLLSQITVDSANKPIYAVDGKVSSDIDKITLCHIKSITVLSNASAIKKYNIGSSNGVVEIITDGKCTTVSEVSIEE